MNYTLINKWYYGTNMLPLKKLCYAPKNISVNKHFGSSGGKLATCGVISIQSEVATNRAIQKSRFRYSADKSRNKFAYVKFNSQRSKYKLIQECVAPIPKVYWYSPCSSSTLYFVDSVSSRSHGAPIRHDLWLSGMACHLSSGDQGRGSSSL